MVDPTEYREKVESVRVSTICVVEYRKRVESVSIPKNGRTSGNEELQSTDILEKLGWLMDESNVLKTVSLEFHKLRDALSLIDLPETISSSDLESQVRWLGESFYQARDEINKLQDEISRTREAAQNEVDRLTTSLLAEIQEKDYLQKELEDLTFSHEKITEREQQISSEKHHMVRALLDASGDRKSVV